MIRPPPRSPLFPYPPLSRSLPPAERRPAEGLGELLRVGRRELRPDREQVLLDGLEQLATEGARFLSEREPDRGVELVHLPVGLDPAVVFRHPPPAEQPRVSPVAGSGVDLHPLSPPFHCSPLPSPLVT